MDRLLYAATTNAGKLRDFAAAAASEGIAVEALPGLSTMPEPPEDFATFMENAAAKAMAYSRLAPGVLVMADDSGLAVDALAGEPGVRSARFADDSGFVGQGTKDQRNNACLLARLHQALTGDRATRSGRFVCALAVARDGDVLFRAEGEAEGEVLDAPRGVNGFGYDPLFLLPSLGQTMAELSPEMKWQVSHRGRAFRELLRIMRQPG